MDEIVNKQRIDEISNMFLKMGQSLLKEGKDRSSMRIMSAGNTLVLLSGVIQKEKDTKKMNDLLAMFSAKNILDDLMKGPLGEVLKGKFDKEVGDDFEGLHDFLGKKGDDDDDGDDD